jgi:hypothetical protein
MAVTVVGTVSTPSNEEEESSSQFSISGKTRLAREGGMAAASAEYERPVVDKTQEYYFCMV